MQRSALPYEATGRFSPIVLDHLAGAGHLHAFRAHPPDRAGLQAAIAARTFDPAARVMLAGALERQYEGVEMHPAVRANIDLLRRQGTCTVTTGHQLCLFTGPLYVPFKVLNVVRLARELSTAPHPVVPVFWMATEDHDRAEIDHAWLHDRKVTWPGEVGGPVGRLPLTGIEEVLAEVDALLGLGTRADEVRELLRRCYRPEHTLARATRLFVNALFGRFGVVILDGDEPSLKRLFAPLMREELLNQVGIRTVEHANRQLEAHYDVQAHARDINLFHLRPGYRARIELRDGVYQVLDGGPTFTPDALLAELEAHPERFSPNVLLRPLYQETILPNIAYVGGGGELAYWFQLKWLFQAFQVPMPVLLLRTSAAFIGEKDLRRITELGLTPPDLFRPLAELEARVATARATFGVSLQGERADVERTYADLAARAKAADPTLEGAVRAQAQRALHGLEAIERKFVRAAKREQEDALQRLRTAHAHLFPGGGLQERRDNLLPFLVQDGPAFLDRLLAELDPLDPRFLILPA